MEMPDREKVVKGFKCILNFSERSDCEQCGYECRKSMFLSVPVNLLVDGLTLLKTQELRYTPREVRNALIEYGQHDINIKLGEVIRYDPVQVEDILTLLKAQEPVEPRVGHDGWYRCGNCNNPLASGERVKHFYGHPWPKYCEECGRMVKWDDQNVL